jgi:Uri superfamily endonuclease
MYFMGVHLRHCYYLNATMAQTLSIGKLLGGGPGSSPPGTYVLVLHAPRRRRLQIGALGRFVFPAGYYLYIGSALNGLPARLRRHLRKRKTCHWHIDYLRGCAEVVEIWYTVSSRRLECRWARAARALEGARVPVAGFGSSDCSCPAHLVYTRHAPNLESFRVNVFHGSATPILLISKPYHAAITQNR